MAKLQKNGHGEEGNVKEEALSAGNSLFCVIMVATLLKMTTNDYAYVISGAAIVLGIESFFAVRHRITK